MNLRKNLDTTNFASLWIASFAGCALCLFEGIEADKTDFRILSYGFFNRFQQGIYYSLGVLLGYACSLCYFVYQCSLSTSANLITSLQMISLRQL